MSTVIFFVIFLVQFVYDLTPSNKGTSICATGDLLQCDPLCALRPAAGKLRGAQSARRRPGRQDPAGSGAHLPESGFHRHHRSPLPGDRISGKSGPCFPAQSGVAATGSARTAPTARATAPPATPSACTAAPPRPPRCRPAARGWVPRTTSAGRPARSSSRPASAPPSESPLHIPGAAD